MHPPPPRSSPAESFGALIRALKLALRGQGLRGLLASLLLGLFLRRLAGLTEAFAHLAEQVANGTYQPCPAAPQPDRTPQPKPRRATGPPSRTAWPPTPGPAMAGDPLQPDAPPQAPGRAASLPAAHAPEAPPPPPSGPVTVLRIQPAPPGMPPDPPNPKKTRSKPAPWHAQIIPL
jgi:hypothetical protein